MNGLERYISIRQAMSILGIKSRSSFDRLCREWKIDKYHFGRSVRVRLSQIQEKIDQARAS